VSGICWLASYPKSGNTWLRAFLTNYRRDGKAPASINDLEGDWTAALRETFDECSGIDSADLTDEQIEYYRPRVYESLAAQSSEALFFKIHDAYTFNSAAYPIFPAQASAGAIYLIRNPLDIAVSLAHHLGKPVEESIRLMNCSDAMLALSDNARHQLPQKLLSWSGHVCSWVDQLNINLHIVRYEDMSQQPTATFRKILRFAGLEIDDSRVEKALEFSRFDQLQAQEAAYGFSEKSPVAASFFRCGRVGSWRESLTAAQVRQVITEHRAVMQRFGYLEPLDEVSA
jgi:hypothetical protein